MGLKCKNERRIKEQVSQYYRVYGPGQSRVFDYDIVCIKINVLK